MQASKLPEFGVSSGSLLDLISHALAPEVRRMMISWTYSSRRYLDFEWSKGCSMRVWRWAAEVRRRPRDSGQHSAQGNRR
jgi:hypothetical protein